MKKTLDSLLRDRPVLVGVFIISYLAIIAVSVGVFSQPLETVLTGIVATPILFEILLRLSLRFVYGKRYRFALYNYFLIDDPLYGNRFRPGITTKNIDFLIYDKYVFRANAKHTVDPAENKRQRVKFSINSLGFRGKEFALHKEPGVVRIFASGGSTTACNWVDDDETWPAALEKFLNAHGIRAEVINGGTQGWYSHQELLRFKKEIVNYEPDIVLLHQGWNEEFNFSSQNLGKWWRPRVARNFIEEKYLYSFPNRFLSGTRSILWFFLMRLYFKDVVFDRNMRFDNPERWRCLQNGQYTRAWADVMVEFAREAEGRGILLYAVNYPGLAAFDDSPDERALYAQCSRVTPLFAEYQALSKKRIQRTLTKLGPVIPFLDAEESFRAIRGNERLKLFHDDIHMTAEGYTKLSETIARLLLADPAFQVLTKGTQRKSNVSVDDARIETTLADIAANYPYVDRAIENRVTALTRERRKDVAEIPSERYTTF